MFPHEPCEQYIAATENAAPILMMTQSKWGKPMEGTGYGEHKTVNGVEVPHGYAFVSSLVSVKPEPRSRLYFF
jgi:hypothetical protein